MLKKQNLINELEILKRLKHPNIIKFKGFYESEHHLFIVMERAIGQNLCSYIKNHGRLTESEAVGYMVELLKAVDYCHKQEIIHHDIKPMNIIVQ